MPNQTEHLVLPEMTSSEVQLLFGPQDRFLETIEKAFSVQVLARNGQLAVKGNGEDAHLVAAMFDRLLKLIHRGVVLSERDILYAIQLVKSGLIDELEHLYTEEITKSYKGKPIRAKTLGQRHYVAAINKYDIVFGIGPAGTGKTYLAVVLATHFLKKGAVKRIVLTRPAVEAGENLGFLPGDLQEKVDPYLRPLYDALHDVLGVEQVAKFLERGIIEIAPLAYMRGRTLDDSFVILDEAQNTTPEQMKMFLTRLGFGSKMVITGDRTQIDLPKGKTSGLIEAERLLKGVEGLSFVYLHQGDVVRHPLVQRIIEAYDGVKEES